MIMDIRLLRSSSAFVCLLVCLSNYAVASATESQAVGNHYTESLATASFDTSSVMHQVPLETIPDTPWGVSEIVIDQLLRADAMDYRPVGFYGRKSSYGMHTHVQYSVVSLWTWAIENSVLRGDTERLDSLIAKWEPFAEGRLRSKDPNHVDFSVYGALPLEIYLVNGDERALRIGLYYADRQWAKPSPDVQPDHGTFDAEEQLRLWERGLSPQSRFWVDDLYMITFLQTNAWRATGERMYIDRAALTMAEYLPKVQLKNGFVYHSPQAPFVWGRGMGWVAAGMALLLDNLPEDSEYRPMILKGYCKMMKSLLDCQSPDGMWRQLVDDEESWSETSCTAMFGYAFACGVRNGWLPENKYLLAARKAWKALLRYIDCYGNIGHVCTGTDRRNSRDWYMNRGTVNGDPHGQAPLLWLATELIRLERQDVENIPGVCD